MGTLILKVLFFLGDFMRITAVGYTHPGLKREENEDCFLIDAKAGFFLVADGMGGHRAGAVASRMAVKKAAEHLRTWSIGQSGALAAGASPRRLIVEAFHRANLAVYEAARANPAYQEMGTTLILGFLAANRCYVAHAGDSRGYLFRDGKLISLTRDHTLTALLVERGHLSPIDAATHPLRHRLERCLGVHPDIICDTMRFQVKSGDVMLLCTDGLWDLVDDDEIGRVIENSPNYANTCKELAAQALVAGGADNITVVLAWAG